MTKSYSRTIDLRAAITANPALAGLEYEVHVLPGGKKRTATFTVCNDDQINAVQAAGFEVNLSPDAHHTPDAPQAKTLDQKAMLAAMSIKGWSGRITDDAATAYTLQQHQAQEGWGRFIKRLVSKDALKDIKAAENAARKAHRELTLPWDERGYRLLPAAAWNEYSKRVGDAKADWQTAVDHLLANYESVVSDAYVALGGLANSDDYPSVEELRERFTFDTEVKALDIKGDFRVQLGDAEIARLQDDIQAATSARLGHAMSDVYRRLHEVVTHMAERLRAYNPEAEGQQKMPFRDATLRNVQDILDIMPALNLTNDPALAQLGQHVQEALLAADAKTLRTDDAKRADVAKQAEEIADAMAAMM